MTHSSHFATSGRGHGAAELAPAIAALFPSGVIAAQLCGLGDPFSLLPEEAALVQKAVLKRQQEFAAGRACARCALRELGQANSIILAAIDRQPIWPQDCLGSITHSGAFCAAVVAKRQSFIALGIDTETVADVRPDLWPTICTVEELQWLHLLPGPSQPLAAALVFCAKEALYKCQYPLTHEWLDFHDLEIAVDASVQRYGLSTQGGFEVRARRPLALSAHVALPIGGRYLVHDCYLTAAIAAPQAADQ